jgi:hypothetical protein
MPKFLAIITIVVTVCPDKLLTNEIGGVYGAVLDAKEFGC